MPRSSTVSRKHDPRKVKSLWHTYAPAAWWPLPVDEAQVRSLSAAYSLRELRQMAAQLGIDAKLSKMALARCIVAERNIFFPHEAGNYDHNTLVFFVRQFHVLPDLHDDAARKLSNVELQSVLLKAWKGGTEEAMNINLQHVLELYDIMQAMEDKFCSRQIQALFREPTEDQDLSFHDYVENALTEVLDLYQQWLSVEETQAKRQVFVATQMAYANAEAAVTEYLRMIRKHCQTESFNDCDADNMPAAVVHWMRTSTWDDRLVLCNVTVKGRNVDFAEGDELIPGYRVGVALRVRGPDRDNVVWLGVGKPNHAMTPVHTPAHEGSASTRSGGPGPTSPPGSASSPFQTPPRAPNYTRPFDNVQLGQLMDVYERQPRGTGQPRYQPVPTAEPAGVPEATGTADPAGAAAGTRPPQTTKDGFQAKALALAKDLAGMGVDVAKQVVIGLLLHAVFPDPQAFSSPQQLGAGAETAGGTAQAPAQPQGQPQGQPQPQGQGASGDGGAFRVRTSGERTSQRDGTWSGAGAGRLPVPSGTVGTFSTVGTSQPQPQAQPQGPGQPQSQGPLGGGAFRAGTLGERTSQRDGTWSGAGAGRLPVPSGTVGTFSSGGVGSSPGGTNAGPLPAGAVGGATNPASTGGGGFPGSFFGGGSTFSTVPIPSEDRTPVNPVDITTSQPVPPSLALVVVPPAAAFSPTVVVPDPVGSTSAWEGRPPRAEQPLPTRPIPVLDLQPRPTYRVPDDDRVQLLDGVGLSSDQPRVQPTYPLVTVPQYAREPDPVCETREYTPAAAPTEQRLTTVSAGVNTEWQVYYGQLVYEMLRQRTPQGYPAFPIVLLDQGTSDGQVAGNRWSLDWGQPQAPQTPVFRRDPDGAFGLDAVVPSGARLTDPTQQSVLAGTFCPAPTLVPFLPELEKLKTQPAFSDASTLQGFSAQVADMTQYRPGGAVVPYVNVAAWLRAAQQAAHRQKEQQKAFLQGLMAGILSHAVTLTPHQPVADPADFASDVSVVVVAPRRQQELYAVVLDNLSSSFLGQLDTLRRNAQSPTFAHAAQRFMNNIRLMWLQSRLLSRGADHPAATAPTVGDRPLPLPTVNPSGLAHQLAHIRGELEQAERFSNVPSTAVVTFSRVELPRVINGVEQCKVHWKDAVGGYTGRNNGGSSAAAVPYGPVRVVNLWDTWINVATLFRALEPEFLATLLNADRMVDETTPLGRSGQAVRDLKALGSLGTQFQTRVEPQSLRTTTDRPVKMSFVDVATAVADLQRDERFRGLLDRYGPGFSTLVRWQNLHAQETYPWKATNTAPLFEEVQRGSSARTNAVYARVTMDRNKQWPATLGSLAQHSNDMRQAANHMSRLGLFLNAWQGAVSLPTWPPPRPVHHPDYADTVKVFEDYAHSLEPMLRAPGPPQYSGHSDVTLWQPDVEHLNRATDQTVQQVQRFAQQQPSAREVAQRYVDQALHFRQLMNRLLAQQAQCRVGVLDLRAARHSLALVPTVATVYVAESVLQNAWAGLLKDTGLTVPEVVAAATPHNQLVVYTVMEAVQRATPVMTDTTEPPVVALVPDPRTLAHVLQTQPVTARDGRFQSLVQNILSKFPRLTEEVPPVTSTGPDSGLSVLGGQTSLTREWSHFPVVAVPRSTLPRPPVPGVLDLPVRLPDPVVPPHSTPLVVPPGWLTRGPVRAKLYARPPPAITPVERETVQRAARVLQNHATELTSRTSLPVSGWVLGLTLWERLPKEPGPATVPTLAPDFEDLTQGLQRLQDAVAHSPVLAHGTQQSVLQATQAVGKVLDQTAWSAWPLAARSPFTSPLQQTHLSPATSQRLWDSFLDVSGDGAAALAPTPAAAETQALVQALKSAYSHTAPVGVYERELGLYVPDLTQLFEGWTVAAGAQLKDGVSRWSEAWTAHTNQWQTYLRAVQTTWQTAEREADAQAQAAAWTRHQQLQTEMAQIVPQAGAALINALVSAQLVGAAAGTSLQTWYRALQEWQEARRLRQEDERERQREQDAVHYQNWRRNVAQGLVESVKEARDIALRSYELGAWMVHWNKWLVTNALGWGWTITQATVEASLSFFNEITAPLMVNGFLLSRWLAVTGWQAVAPKAVGLAQTALTQLSEAAETGAQRALTELREGFARLPSGSEATGVLLSTWSGVSGLTRTAFNAAVTYATTLDLAWTGQVLEFLQTTSRWVASWAASLAQDAVKGVAALQPPAVQLARSIQAWFEVTSALAREAVALASQPRALRHLQDRYGRDPTTPLVSGDDRALGGFYREQLRQGRISDAVTGEKLVPTEVARAELSRFGIGAGSIYAAVAAPGGGTAALAPSPTLVGPVSATWEGLVPRRIPLPKSWLVGTSAVRKLRTSERQRKANLNALFHQRTGTRVVSLTPRTALPSWHLAHQPPLSAQDAATRHASSLLSAFFRDAARTAPRGHAAHSVRDLVQDQLEAVGNAVLAVPAANRRTALVEALHGLGDKITLDDVVCLTAPLAALVNGVYSMVYRQDLAHYCFTRTLPLELAAAVSSTTRSHILSDPARIGVLMDPAWQAHDAEALLRALAQYRYPSTPFCLVGDASGPAGSAQCVPIFGTSVPVSGASLFASLTDVYNAAQLQGETVLTTALAASAYVNHATVDRLDRDTWSSIVARSTAVGVTLGTPLPTTLGALGLANQEQLAEVRLADDQLRTLVVHSYAQHADPLTAEYFKLPFRLVPVGPSLAQMQRSSDGTTMVPDFLLLERNGIHGSALLMQFRDWLVQRVPHAINAYDSYLTQALRTSQLDRHLLLLTSVRWLAEVASQLRQAELRRSASSLTRTAPLAVIPVSAALFTRPRLAASPDAFLAPFRREYQDQFGSVFTAALVGQAQEITLAAQTFLNTTNTAGFFQMCALSWFARTRERHGLEIDITPALWGALVIQANNSALICERLPLVEGDRTRMTEERRAAWLDATQLVTNAQRTGAPPFRYNSHWGGERFGQCQAEPLVRSTNLAHAALTVPWSEMRDDVRAEIAEGLQTLGVLQNQVQDASVAGRVTALLGPVNRDMCALHRLNGSEMTAQCWSPDATWGENLLQQVEALAGENTTLLQGANTDVVFRPMNLTLEPFEFRTFQSSFTPDRIKEIETEARFNEEARTSWWGFFEKWKRELTIPLAVPAMVMAPVAGTVALMTNVVVLPLLREAISETSWWKDTEAMLAQNVHPGVLSLTKLGGEVLITLAVGKFVVSFSPQQLPDYERALYDSPLSVFMRASSLHAQLDTAGVDDATRQMVVALQEPSLHEAARKFLGTTTEAIDQFARAYERRSLDALCTFIESFQHIRPSQRLNLLDAINLHQFFSSRNDVTGLRPEVIETVQGMVENAQRAFTKATLLAQTMGPAGEALKESSVALARSLVAMVDRISEGNALLPESVRQQLAHIPLAVE